jgi:hypothetical protein
VVRGGYGLSYVHFNRAGGGNLLPINGPQVINAVVNQSPSDATFVPTEQGYPVGLADPTKFNPLTANITYMPEDYHSSPVQLAFLTGMASRGLAYVGNRRTTCSSPQPRCRTTAPALSLQSRRPSRTTLYA